MLPVEGPENRTSARFSTHPALRSEPAFLRGENYAGRARDIALRRYDTPNITTPSPPTTQSLYLRQPLRFTTLILDFGDVLCLYADTKAPMPLPPFEVKHILGSDWWHLYETGSITREECFSKITEYYKLAPNALQESIEVLAGEARYDEGLIGFVRNLRKGL